jgi:hypothetical protein
LVLAAFADGAPEEGGTAAAGEDAEKAAFAWTITNCAGPNHGHFLTVLLGEWSNGFFIANPFRLDRFWAFLASDEVTGGSEDCSIIIHIFEEEKEYQQQGEDCSILL